MSGASVAWLTVAPVKGLALQAVEEVELGPTGARGDRLFHLVDADGRLLNRKQAPALAGIGAEPDGDRLVLRFPDGLEVGGAVVAREEVSTSFYGRLVAGRVVEGPFAAALSARVRRPVRLVRVAEGAAHDRGAAGAVSLLSTASLAELGRVAGTAAEVDPRRFRMLIGVDGVDPHEEDGWLGRLVDVGAATVRPAAHCGRCAVTTQDPDTGVVTLDTLRVLRDYRGDVESEEPLPFGVWGEVVTPGRVRVGDPVRAR
jgi:uncharacterized protein YcbX